MDEATVRTKSFVKLRGCCSWVLALHRGSSCSSLSLDTCPVVWDSLHAVASNPPSRIRGVSKPFHKLKNLIYLSSKFEVISFTHTFPNSHAGGITHGNQPTGSAETGFCSPSEKIPAISTVPAPIPPYQSPNPWSQSTSG